MRETVKDLVKSSVISIGMDMTIFCLVGVVFDVGYKGFGVCERSYLYGNGI